jgi:long-chain acyl-CoA synthetase
MMPSSRPVRSQTDTIIGLKLHAKDCLAKAVPKNKCLGHRPWNTDARTFGQYVWQDFATVAERRKDFGAGLVHVHEKNGVTGTGYGVGLWCTNRPEWQITGRIEHVTGSQ